MDGMRRKIRWRRRRGRQERREREDYSNLVEE
jgi:hypothetical protein